MTGDVEIRPAELADYDDVVAFASDTWADRREDGDYIPQVFEEWVETDGPEQRTLVADTGHDVAAVAQFVLLSEHEAWAQGMRTNPDYRGRGVGSTLVHAGFDWARERGATVARNMVFSWNVMGLGHSRAVGFEPATEFRWVHPEPDADATPDHEVTADANAAWQFWQDSAARDHLRGLALHTDESWALAELTRERLAAAADRDALAVAQDDAGTRGFAFRSRTFDRDEQTWAEYGVAAGADEAACASVLDAIAADAASVGADRTRVLIPETAATVSDVAVTRTEIGEEPDFVMAADLTADYRA
ncbi:GNAT family N-acetyltransferase [Halobacterium sp. CBA1126]|uniref:GNAT family N-acetyltransferase n=1 Tax=Halobacterium sp. CBA1126 TaxID=2668074 RepID=UPI0012F84C39|nr:GNAT family N-acetyltransferase [Halobacterium sp. CBA1126]MUV61780.1 GNAT family N-acetyltransferase [Halobacterium sp. CBA1126]